MPRGRIRAWENGSKPDPARAVEVAERRDWFADLDSPTGLALVELVAWIFSGGSISEDTYRPRFTYDSEPALDRATAALDTIDIEYRHDRADHEDHPPEIVATEHGSILGRALVTLGAPAGPKATQALSLPSWLHAEDCPAIVRETFVDVYLLNRATRPDNRTAIRLREERSATYLNSLAELIESVADERVTVSDKNVCLSSEATEALYGRIGTLG